MIKVFRGMRAQILGSARASHAGDNALAIANFSGSPLLLL